MTKIPRVSVVVTDYEDIELNDKVEDMLSKYGEFTRDRRTVRMKLQERISDAVTELSEIANMCGLESAKELFERESHG